jgi:hypothetical protein
MLLNRTTAAGTQEVRTGKFFSEEKNQKTFVPAAASTIEAMAGIWPQRRN